MLPHTALSRRIDPLLVAIGRWVSWIWLALLAIIVANVLLRYAFGEGRIEFEEIQWHLYSVGFLRFGARTQAWIELYGILLLLLPFIALVAIFSVPFVQQSYAVGEVSQAPGGLPYRWLIKAALPLGFLLLLLAAISRLSRVWAFLFFGRDADA